jgi:hypothetical protein
MATRLLTAIQVTNRRLFLQAASLSSILSFARADDETARNRGSRGRSQALRNAALLGNWLVQWQSPYGSTDSEKCPYRTPGYFDAFHLHPSGPAGRALYKLRDATGTTDYKNAADRYITFLLAAIQDPVKPYVNWTMLNGRQRNYLSSSWMYGEALSSYASFRQHNPKEDCFELRAYSVYRDLQQHRRADSYFGVGYPALTAPDAQFACDLAQVGVGLTGFYETANYRPALDDALGLARFFLTEWQEGSGRGLWSSKIGTWLVGPWPGTGAEHFTNQQFNTSGWVPGSHMVAEFLLRLHPHVEDASLRATIEERCRRACEWTFKNCQFDDGAVGLFGRDDKWLGMTASGILQYLALERVKAVPDDFQSAYRPRVEKSWKWLVANTKRDSFPNDGYIRVSGTTTKKPLENLMWYISYGIEGLVEGSRYFES